MTIMKILDEQQWLSRVRTELPVVQRVLVLAPHPDDEIIGCGGALALLKEQGAEVSIVILSDGAMGGDNPDGQLADLRAEESRHAACVLGIPEPSFWSLPDRSLTYGEVLISRIRSEILAKDPEVVFLPSPTEIHPDHQAVALSGAEALRRLQGQRLALFYEVGVPLPTPNLLVSIDHVAGQKQQALRCFVSQLLEQPYIERTNGLNTFRAYHLGPRVMMAEAFRQVTAAEMDHGLGSWLASPLLYRHRHDFAAIGKDIPLVSIIVRSMQRVTLDGALDSLAQQTYPNLEVVVVNAKGGEHGPVSDRGGRFQIEVLNQGGEPLLRAAAANIGLSGCHGEYIGFLDDDDELDPDHVQRLVQALQAARGEVLVYTGVRCVRRDDPARTVLHLFAERSASFGRLLMGNFIPIHAALFHSGLLRRGLRFDETLAVYEDWDFWLQAIRLSPFVFVDAVSATYFDGGTSGISFREPDASIIRAGVFRVWTKWAARIGPEEIQSCSDLYQGLCGDLSAAGHQLEEMRLRLSDGDARIRSLSEELEAARASALAQRPRPRRSPVRALLRFTRNWLRSSRQREAGSAWDERTTQG